MDGFHYPQRVLVELGRRERMGAPDTFDAGALTALLYGIHEGQHVLAPAFDRRSRSRYRTRSTSRPARASVVEGNYLLLWPEVHALLERGALPPRRRPAA